MSPRTLFIALALASALAAVSGQFSSGAQCMSGSACLRSTCGVGTINGRKYCCPCPSAGIIFVGSQCSCRGGGGVSRPINTPRPTPSTRCRSSLVNTYCGSAFRSCLNAAPTSTPMPSASASASSTPFPSPSISASSTPLPSQDPNATSTPVPTPAPSATSTPFPTGTPTPTSTPMFSATCYKSKHQCFTQLKNCIRRRWTATQCNSITYCQSQAYGETTGCTRTEIGRLCRTHDDSATPVPTPTPPPPPTVDTKLQDKVFKTSYRKEDGCYESFLVVGNIVAGANYNCKYARDQGTYMRVLRTTVGRSGSNLAVVSNPEILGAAERYVYRWSGSSTIYTTTLSDTSGEWNGYGASGRSMSRRYVSDPLPYAGFSQGKITYTAAANGGARVSSGNVGILVKGNLFIITEAESGASMTSSNSYVGVMTDLQTMRTCSSSSRDCELNVKVSMTNSPGPQDLYASFKYKTTGRMLTVTFNDPAAGEVFTLEATAMTTLPSLKFTGAETSGDDPCQVELALSGPAAFAIFHSCLTHSTTATSVSSTSSQYTGAVTIGTEQVQVSVTGDNVSVQRSGSPDVAGHVWGSLSANKPVVSTDKCNTLKDAFEACANKMTKISETKLSTPVSELESLCGADKCRETVKEYVTLCGSRWTRAGADAVRAVNGLCAKGTVANGQEGLCWAIAASAKQDDQCDYSGLPIDIEAESRIGVDSWLRSSAFDTWVSSKRADFCAKGCGDKLGQTFACLTQSGELAYSGLVASTASMTKAFCLEKDGAVCINTLKELMTMSQAEVMSMSTTGLTTTCNGCADEILAELSVHADTRQAAQAIGMMCMKDGGEFCWPRLQKLTPQLSASNGDLSTLDKEVLDQICENRCFFKMTMRSMELSSDVQNTDMMARTFRFLCVKNNGGEYCSAKLNAASDSMSCAIPGAKGSPSTMPRPSPPSQGCDSVNAARCGTEASECMKSGATMQKTCACLKLATNCLVTAGCPVTGQLCQSISGLGCDVSSTNCPESSSTPTALPPSTSTPPATPSLPANCDLAKSQECATAASECAKNSGADVQAACSCARTALNCLKTAKCWSKEMEDSCERTSNQFCSLDCSATRLLEQINHDHAVTHQRAMRVLDSTRAVVFADTLPGLLKATFVDNPRHNIKEAIARPHILAMSRVPDELMSQLPHIVLDQAACDPTAAQRCQTIATDCMRENPTDVNAACTCTDKVLNCLVNEAGCGGTVVDQFCSQLPPSMPCNFKQCSGASTGAPSTPAPPQSTSAPALGSCDASALTACTESIQSCVTNAGTNLDGVCTCMTTTLDCINRAGCPIPMSTCQSIQNIPGCTASCDGSAASTPVMTGAPAPTPGQVSFSCPSSCRDSVTAAFRDMGCCGASLWDFYTETIASEPSARGMVGIVKQGLEACGAELGGEKCKAAELRTFKREARLRMKWSWVEKNMARFREEFRGDVANNLGISKNEVVITKVGRASDIASGEEDGETRLLQEAAEEIVVDYEVKGDDSVGESLTDEKLQLTETAAAYESETGASLEVASVSGDSGRKDGGGDSKGMSTAIIVGIAVGGVVALAAIIGVVVVLTKKKSAPQTSLPPGHHGGVVGPNAQPMHAQPQPYGQQQYAGQQPQPSPYAQQPPAPYNPDGLPPQNVQL